MKAAGKLIILTTVLLLVLPTVSFPQSRYRREDGKAFAYRAGYDDGYRDGHRQGISDRWYYRRFNYRTREYNRADMHYRPEFRYKGDYKKGYKDGFRIGYERAYGRYLRIRR